MLRWAVGKDEWSTKGGKRGRTADGAEAEGQAGIQPEATPLDKFKEKFKAKLKAKREEAKREEAKLGAQAEGHAGGQAGTGKTFIDDDLDDGYTLTNFSRYA